MHDSSVINVKSFIRLGDAVTIPGTILRGVVESIDRRTSDLDYDFTVRWMSDHRTSSLARVLTHASIVGYEGETRTADEPRRSPVTWHVDLAAGRL